MSDIEKQDCLITKRSELLGWTKRRSGTFSVKDVVTILTETNNMKDYISKIKEGMRNYPKGGDKLSTPLQQSGFLDKTLLGKPNRVLPKYKVAFIVNGF